MAGTACQPPTVAALARLAIDRFRRQRGETNAPAARWPDHRLRAGRGTDQDSELLDAAAEMADSPLVADDTRGVGCRLPGGLGLRAVDYAGLLEV